MKKVVVNPGCTSCGTCEFIAPEVFQITDISHVKADADFKKNACLIKEATIACPVSVISYEE